MCFKLKVQDFDTNVASYQNSEAMISIDMPAGPSEVLVIADKHANPVHVAADLLSQVFLYLRVIYQCHCQFRSCILMSALPYCCLSTCHRFLNDKASCIIDMMT